MRWSLNEYLVTIRKLNEIALSVRCRRLQYKWEKICSLLNYISVKQYNTDVFFL